MSVEPNPLKEPDLHRIPVPMWGPLETMNIYLVEQGSRVWLIDAGHQEGAEDVIATHLREVGYEWDQVERICVTHTHIDHAGLAATLSDRCSPAEVLIHERIEQLIADPPEVENWYERAGAPREIYRSYKANDIRSMVYWGRPQLRDRGRFVSQGDTVVGARRSLDVLTIPGHAPDHLAFFHRESGLLFSGDLIVPGMPPQVGRRAGQGGNPLREFVRSLSSLLELPVRWVLPGHGDPFRDLSGEVERVLRYQVEGLSATYQNLKEDPATIWELASQEAMRLENRGIDRLRPVYQFILISRIYARIRYLESRDLLEVEEDGVPRFRARRDEGTIPFEDLLRSEASAL